MLGQLRWLRHFQYLLSGAQIVEVRRLDVVVACRARFDAVLVEGDVTATGIEGDFLFCRDADFIFGAGDFQPMARQQLQFVVLRLDAHRPLIGDQLDPQLAHEQAQALPHPHKQALDHADIGAGPGVDHQVVLRGQLQVFAAGEGDALGGAEQQHR